MLKSLPYTTDMEAVANGLQALGVKPAPYNGVKDEPFRVVTLDPMTAAGYSDARWATFKQWRSAGRFVKRGQKGTQIESAKTGYTFYVFNIEQTDSK